MDASAAAGAEPEAYVPELDLVRFGAAVAVAAFHLTWQFGPLSDGLPLGWVGVQVFFVLSGLVIARSAERVDALTFLRHRALRLYPGAWLCAAVSVVVVALLDGGHGAVGIQVNRDPGAVAASVALVGQRFIASAYWTLPVEIGFYLVVAAVIGTWPGAGLDALARALIGWSAMFSAATAFGALSPHHSDLGYGLANATLLRHGHYFGLGMLLWISARSRAGPGVGGWMALAAGLSVWEITDRAAEIVARSPSAVDPGTLACGAFGLWFVACLAMARAVRAGREAAPTGIALRPIRILGLLTYPLYLLHEAVGGSVMGRLLGAGLAPTAALAVALLATVLLAALVALRGEPLIRAALRARTVPACADRAG